MAQPPNAFSNELGQWICREFRESVVFVELRPKDPDKVFARWQRVNEIPRTDEEKYNQRKKESKQNNYSTGSLIKDANGRIYILTSAHVMGEAFTSTNPITVKQIEQLFLPMILCDHRELRFINQEDPRRIHCNARVEHVSCARDLLLLSVPKGLFGEYCSGHHRILSMAPNAPSSLQTLAMLSWPPSRHRTVVTGEASHPGRVYRNVSSTNSLGYTMRLAEVNITSEKGSSGALLLNGSGEYVGALHGGNDTGFSYFICFQDLRNTLREWGMVE